MAVANESREYDAIVIGAGVTGTALIREMTNEWDFKRVCLIDKFGEVAMVNSNARHNSQTLHFGTTETNYGLKHALKVNEAASLIENYIVSNDTRGLYKKTHRMVLGVGEKQVKLLHDRLEEFGPYFSDLRIADRDELARIEPMVIEGRDPREEVCALVTEKGYAVNYQILSKCFLDDSFGRGTHVDAFFNTELTKVRREDGWHILDTDQGEFRAKVVLFASGSYSLFFAQQLGYGMDLGILSMAGSFFSAGKILQGKVYLVQIEGIPFAALHGDPDVSKEDQIRLGPITKPLPLMERHRYNTFKDYRKLPTWSPKGLRIVTNILLKNKLVEYVARNMLYQSPVLGKLMFLRQARVIVPTIRYRDLKFLRGEGGLRPQIVNMTTGVMEMGNKTIVGDNCIFITTPSPGASVCMADARQNAETAAKFLGVRRKVKTQDRLLKQVVLAQ